MHGLKIYNVILMLGMLALAFVQVIRRYALNIPWVWSDEIILIMLGWFSYPALVFNIWTDDHFSITGLYERFPKPLRLACDLLRHILIGIFCAYLGYFGWKLTKQFWPKPLPASRFTQGLRYIPVIFGGAVSALFCVSNLIGAFIDPAKPMRLESAVSDENQAHSKTIQNKQEES